MHPEQCRSIRIFLKKQNIMNSTIFPVTDDFGYILNTLFELVDLRFLVVYLLSFLTLVAFGLLFLYAVVIVVLVEIFQERTPAVIRLAKRFCLFILNILYFRLRF